MTMVCRMIRSIPAIIAARFRRSRAHAICMGEREGGAPASAAPGSTAVGTWGSMLGVDAIFEPPPMLTSVVTDPWVGQGQEHVGHQIAQDQERPTDHEASHDQPIVPAQHG